MPLNVQYHKHPTIHFTMEMTWLFYWFRNQELLQEIYFSHSQRTVVRITVPRKKTRKVKEL